jgi:tubby-related protein 1
MFGTQFTVYDYGLNPAKGVSSEDIRREMISIVYDTNILGFKGPRKMSVLMPGMSLDHQRVEVRPRNVTILEPFFSNPFSKRILFSDFVRILVQ